MADAKGREGGRRVCEIGGGIEYFDIFTYDSLMILIHVRMLICSYSACTFPFVPYTLCYVAFV